MTNRDDHVRSFGMSGMLICDEIRAIEKRFGIRLGNAAPVDGGIQDDNSQFEMSVRREARAMASHYELFYCLEKSIRKVISEAFEESQGADWWNKGKIPEEIVREVRANIAREVDSGVTRRSDAELDFTTFGQLGEIIKSNWDLFESILTSRAAVGKVMASLNTLRSPIAHCCPLAEDEVVRLKLAVKDWFRMFG